MTYEDDDTERLYSLCLRVVADFDPSVLPRILGLFQNLNVTPRRVVAETGIGQKLYIRVEVADYSEERLALIAAKVGQFVCISTAYWHRL
jgi:hypothetical protein